MCYVSIGSWGTLTPPLARQWFENGHVTRFWSIRHEVEAYGWVASEKVAFASKKDTEEDAASFLLRPLRLDVTLGIAAAILLPP